jgi:hypothetical protein
MGNFTSSRLGRALTLFGVGLLAASCSSHHVAVTTTTAKASTTTSTVTPTSARGAGVPSCPTGVLATHATFGGAAAGSSYYLITIADTGPHPCTLDGYPDLKFFAPSGAGGAGAGAPLALAITHGGPAPSPVTLRAGHAGESLLIFSDNGGSDCPAVGSALLTPPGSSEALPLALSFSPCGGGVRVYAVGSAGSESP